MSESQSDDDDDSQARKLSQYQLHKEQSPYRFMNGNWNSRHTGS